MNGTLKASKVSKQYKYKLIQIQTLIAPHEKGFSVTICDFFSHKIVLSENEENETQPYFFYSFGIEELRYVVFLP